MWRPRNAVQGSDGERSPARCARAGAVPGRLGGGIPAPRPGASRNLSERPVRRSARDRVGYSAPSSEVACAEVRPRSIGSPDPERRVQRSATAGHRDRPRPDSAADGPGRGTHREAFERPFCATRADGAENPVPCRSRGTRTASVDPWVRAELGTPSAGTARAFRRDGRGRPPRSAATGRSVGRIGDHRPIPLCRGVEGLDGEAHGPRDPSAGTRSSSEATTSARPGFVFGSCTLRASPPRGTVCGRPKAERWEGGRYRCSRSPRLRPNGKEDDETEVPRFRPAIRRGGAEDAEAGRGPAARDSASGRVGRCGGTGVLAPRGPAASHLRSSADAATAGTCGTGAVLRSPAGPAVPVPIGVVRKRPFPEAPPEPRPAGLGRVGTREPSRAEIGRGPCLGGSPACVPSPGGPRAARSRVRRCSNVFPGSGHRGARGQAGRSSTRSRSRRDEFRPPRNRAGRAALFDRRSGPDVAARHLARSIAGRGRDDRRGGDDQSPTTRRTPAGKRADAGLPAVVTVTCGPPTRPRRGGWKATGPVFDRPIGASATPRRLRAGEPGPGAA